MCLGIKELSESPVFPKVEVRWSIPTVLKNIFDKRMLRAEHSHSKFNMTTGCRGSFTFKEFLQTSSEIRLDTGDRSPQVTFFLPCSMK